MAFSELFCTDRTFYRRIAAIALPLCLQQVLNSTMGIVDSAMVSRIGGITAVGTANNITEISSSFAFGITTGIGIYLTQYFGAKKELEQKRVFSLGLLACAATSLLCILAVCFFSPQMMGFYVSDSAVVEQSVIYLRIVSLSFVPSSMVLMFSFAYRSAQRTIVPFVIGLIGAAVNCGLNYLLIFGNFGFPELGIAGAAIATLIAHLVNLFLHIAYARRTRQSFFGSPIAAKALSFFQLEAISRRAMPLVFNEVVFGFGSTLYIKAFGVLGSAALESYYVGNQVAQIFTFITFGIQNAISSILGNTLGKNDIALARKQGQYFVGISLVFSMLTVGIVYTFARPIASIFSLSSPQALADAVAIVRIFSIKIALRMFIVLVFACLRAGGDSKFLVFLDAGMMWLVGIPLTCLCVYGFHMESITQVFLIIQIEQVVRMVCGLIRYRQGAWLNNLTEEGQT